ncbi:hypothetical protein OJE16_08475 [Pantoea tagorei]
MALLAIGMTLVIATGGIDLSVGAVMAIAGATAATLTVAGHSLTTVIFFRAGCRPAVRVMERRAGGAAAHSAVCRHADFDGGGARHRAADYPGADRYL